MSLMLSMPRLRSSLPPIPVIRSHCRKNYGLSLELIRNNPLYIGTGYSWYPLCSSCCIHVQW